MLPKIMFYFLFTCFAYYMQVLKVMSKSLLRVQQSLFAFSFSSMVHIGTNSKAFFIASAILFQTAIILAKLCIVFIFLCSLGEVAKLFADAGVICIASLISPYRRDRDACRALMPDANFIEVGASCHCIFYIDAVYRHHNKLFPIYLRPAVLSTKSLSRALFPVTIQPNVSLLIIPFQAPPLSCCIMYVTPHSSRRASMYMLRPSPLHLLEGLLCTC